MSVILDALKKAQEERKKITKKVAFGFGGTSPDGSPARTKKRLYYIIGGAVIVILAMVALPSFIKLKAPGPQTKMAKNVPAPVTVKTVQAPAPQKTEPSPTPAVAAPVKAEPQQIQKTAVQKAPVKQEVTGIKEKRKETSGDMPPPQENSLKEKKVVTRKPAKDTVKDERKTTDAANAKKAYAEKMKELRKQTDTKTASAHSSPVPQPQIEKPRGETHVIVKKVDDEKMMQMYNNALREMERGNTREAKKLYMIMLVEHPNNVEVLNNLGAIAMNEGNNKEAIYYFRKILDVKKDYGKVYNNMGLAMMREGERKLAEEYFRKSIELERESIEPYLNLTALLRGEGRFEEASNLLRYILDKGAKNPTIYLSYAIIKDELKQPDEAIKYYRYYLRSGVRKAERNQVIERLKQLEESQFTKNR